MDLQDKKIIDCFKEYVNFKELGANNTECIKAIELFLNDGDLNEYKEEVAASVVKRQMESYKEAMERTFINMRHEYVRKLAITSSYLELKGTLTSKDGHKYKVNGTKRDSVIEEIANDGTHYRFNWLGNRLSED